MASRKKTIAEPSIHVLHVELVGIQPAIWRELHVRSDMPLSKLHDVMQEAFGWTHSHMHVFKDTSRWQYGHKAPGDADDFGFGGTALLDERKYTVADIAPRARSIFGYMYDFGDDWVHRIRVKKVQPPSQAGDTPPAPQVREQRRPMTEAASLATSACTR